jgi:uncharacterized protein involved in tolerance to divalent cations
MGLHSLVLYRWKEKLEEDRENLLIIKTTESKIEQLKETIKKIHPYLKADRYETPPPVQLAELF